MNGLVTYNDKDDLKDGTSFVSSPIGITEESTNKGEDVDSASPFADIVGCISIVLAYHTSQEQHQVHSYPEEC